MFTNYRMGLSSWPETTIEEYYSMSKIYYRILLNLLFFFTISGGTVGIAQAQYCVPTYTNACTSLDIIDNVQFVTINQTATGCGNATTNYSDLTATVSTTVAQGNTYPISVTPGASWGQYFVAFIDLNQDQDFADAGEFFDLGYAAAGQTITSNITIPLATTVGTTRLRVMCRFSTPVLTQADVCATGLNYGEVEDYGLTVIPPPPIDLSTIAMDSPGSGCGLGNETVAIQVLNQGTTTITNFVGCYTVDGGTAVCQPFTVNLTSGDTAFLSFTVPANVSSAGTHTLNAWVTILGDGNTSNDTLGTQTIFNYGIPTGIPYSEDFEASDGNWSYEGDSSLTQWQWGAPTGTFISAAAGGTNAWVTNLSGNYLSHSNNDIVYMRSPCYDFSTLTADPFIAFSHLYNTESCCDESWLELSTDAGTTWGKVGTSATGNNWYNDTFNDEWDGDSEQPGVWRTADHRLTGAAGSNRVFLRFAFSSDGSVEREGFGVDNVLIIDTIINGGVASIEAPLNGCSLTATEAVTVTLSNPGTHDLVNPTVCFSINGAAAVCEVASITIPSGSTATYTFLGTADLSAVAQYDFNAYIVVTGDSIIDNDTLSSDVVNFPVINSFPYVEDFESGPGFWISDGTNNDWQLGTPGKLNIQGAASGSNAWVTGTTGFLNYQPNSDHWVEGPCFDLSGQQDAWVGMNIWWETDNGSDGAVMEYSLDGGSTWSEIGQYLEPDWYNNTSINGLVNINGSGDGWSGRSGGNGGSEGYVFAKHDLDSIAGQSNVRFRVHFASDGFGNFDGIAFDDFSIAVPPTVDLGNDTIVCEDLILTPNLAANGVFQWDSVAGTFPVQIDSTPSITIANSGMYALTFTDSLGFCDRDSIIVTINTTPVVDLGADLNVCDGTGSTIAVDSMAYPNVVWSTSATTPSIVVTTATTIFVDVVDTVGCISSDTLTTAIVPLPQFSLGADTVICQGDTLCMSTGFTGPGFTHLWSTGATTETVCTNIVSGYWAIAIDSNGCEWADSVILTPGPAVPTTSFGIDSSNCPVISFSGITTGTVDNVSWNFGDNNTSTAINPSNDYSTAGNGIYNVFFVASNSCGSDTTTLSLNIACLVSITEGLDNHLFVYPNPNQGQFRVVTELSGSDVVSWQIVDLQGRIVEAREYGEQSGNFSADIALDQAKGVYFLRFQVGEKMQTEKIIVE